MHGGKSGCGHWGHDKDKGDMSEWKEKWAKMSDSEKKEMLKMKLKHLKEKTEWAEGEMKKLEA